MKKLCILFGVIFIPIYVSSQDIIYKSDGTEIKSKVIEIKADKIDYFNFGETQDTLRNVPINEVFMIIYEGGTREVFKKEEKADSIDYNKNNSQSAIISKYKASINIIDKRENKVVVGKAPSNLARGIGLIVQPTSEIKDEGEKIYGYAVLTLKKILEVNGFIGDDKSKYTLEINLNELYHKAEVGIYGTGGDITQNCRCTVALKDDNGTMFNKEFISTYSAKTSDFSNQEDLLYQHYYSIPDKKELKNRKKADFKESASKGHFINFIIVLDDIISQLGNDEEFTKIFKIYSVDKTSY